MKLLHSMLVPLVSLCFWACQKSSTHVPLKPSEQYWQDRFGPGTEQLIQKKTALYQRVKAQMSLRNPDFEGSWTLQGPANIGGRVSTFAIHPTDPKTMYAGFSVGGIFKTTDGGMHWQPIFDQASNLAIGAIAIDPRDPEIIYAGTGDPDIPGGVFVGNGLYKSLDGGKSWNHLGLSETRVINEIIVDPGDSKIVWLAAMGNPFTRNFDRGVYVSHDAGLQWTKSLYVNDSTGATDICLKPNNSNVIYAAMWHRVRNDSSSTVQGTGSGIYRSTDRGLSWQKIHDGIENQIFGRIAIEVCQAAPEIIYARMVYNDGVFCGGGHQFGKLYKSSNAGNQWNEVPVLFDESSIPCDALGGFGWYFGRMAVNPKDPDDLYALGVNLYRSRDGGIQWRMESPPWWTYDVHADKHELEFLPNGDFVLGTDGGLYHYDIQNETWTDIENIPSTQFYRVAYNPHRPDWFYGGAQDNGTSGGQGTDMENWQRIYGGDGFLPAFHPTDPLIFWALTQNGGLNQTQDGGISFDRFTEGLNGSKNWDMPYLISHHSADRMYAGAQRVYANDQATTPDWYSISPNLASNGPYKTASTPTLTCLDESKINPNVLIAGSNSGNVWITSNLGRNWILVHQGLPAALITSVKCSHEDDRTFYVTASSYRNDQLSSMVYKTTDNGTSWTNITGGDLSENPVFDLQILKSNSDDDLAVGTLTGVYARVNGNNNWKRLGNNMPIVPVNDLALNPVTGVLIAGTYARGIYSFPIKDIVNSTKTESETTQLNILHYPNPSTDFIFLQSNKNLSEVQLIWCDASGKIYKRDKTSLIAHQKSAIDLSLFPTGTYLLKIMTDERELVRKVVKM
ncbi:MAG: T9SS type A sorting domain-containing protein [Saprospiraceae bacterium]|nr:T9SS type A sorting domain-containing protein [Saprospiraceae bacterium]